MPQRSETSSTTTDECEVCELQATHYVPYYGTAVADWATCDEHLTQFIDPRDHDCEESRCPVS